MLPREITIFATRYDGADHWRHPATLLHAASGLYVTQTWSGLQVVTHRGDFTSQFNTNGHYWEDRWFNVIRLERPGIGLVGFYCNVSTPADFDGARLHYVDLQLDVRVFAEGDWRCEVWDEDEFEVAVEAYQYPKDLIGRARGAVEELIRMAGAREYPFTDNFNGLQR